MRSHRRHLNSGTGLPHPAQLVGRSRFSRASRLLDATDYDRVFRRARRSKDRYFTVLFGRAGRSEARLGLAIAKKHCKLATGRNRIKRLVRESFRQHQPALHGLDIVVMNTRATHTADNATLRESLEQHWTRRPQPGN